MPDHLKNKYQYYTQAEIKKLREVGYDKPLMDIYAGAIEYVQKH